MIRLTLLLPLLLLIAITSCSQTDPQAVQAPADYCLLKDGKMTVMKGGEAIPLTENMTMSDGSMCLTDGTCKLKDGTIRQLKEGECMMMDGRMTMHPGSIKRPAMKADNQMHGMKM